MAEREQSKDITIFAKSRFPVRPAGRTAGERLLHFRSGNRVLLALEKLVTEKCNAIEASETYAILALIEAIS